jgi:hypothetical protein
MKNNRLSCQAVCRCGLFILISLFCSPVFGQQAELLRGRVLDASTGAPLAGATIFDKTHEKGAIAAADGRFALSIANFPVTLEVSFLGFESLETTLDVAPQSEWLVRLQPAVADLPAAEITAVRPSTPLTAKRRSVIDFKIMEGKLILLTTTGTTGKDRLEMRELEGGLLDSLSLKKMPGAKSLHQSCLGNVHLVHKESKVYALPVKKGIFLGLVPPISYSEYETEVMSCVLSNRDYMYFRFDRYEGQMVDIEAFARQGGSNFRLATFIDEENIERFYEEILGKYREDGEMSAVSITNPVMLQKLRNRQENLDAYLHLFYQPLNISIHQKGEEVAVFDHHHGKLVFYQISGEWQREVELQYHRDKRWKGEVLADRATGKFYTLMQSKEGYAVHEINLEDGSLLDPVFFNCQFGEAFSVYAGHLYFLDSEGAGREFGMNNILRRVRL